MKRFKILVLIIFAFCLFSCDGGSGSGNDDGDGPINIATGSFSIPLATYSRTDGGYTYFYKFKSGNKLDTGYDSIIGVSDVTYVYNSSDGTLEYSYPYSGGTVTIKHYHVFTVTKDGKTHLILGASKRISGDPTQITGIVIEYRSSQSLTGSASDYQIDTTQRTTYHADGTYTSVTTDNISGEKTTTTDRWDDDDLWSVAKINSDYYIYDCVYTQQ